MANDEGMAKSKIQMTKEEPSANDDEAASRSLVICSFVIPIHRSCHSKYSVPPDRASLLPAGHNRDALDCFSHIPIFARMIRGAATVGPRNLAAKSVTDLDVAMLA